MVESRGEYVIDRMENLCRWAHLGEGFRALAEFLGRGGLAELAPGRHEIDGGRVFVNCDEPRYVRAPERRFEQHRRFFDVHVPLTDDERIGLAPSAGVEVADFDDGRDIGFVDAAPGAVYRTVARGEFCLVWPGTCLHAPAVAVGAPHDARKLVAKVFAGAAANFREF